MNNIKQIKDSYRISLEIVCKESGVNFESMEILLELEAKKKLARRMLMMQESIDNEIAKYLEDED